MRAEQRGTISLVSGMLAIAALMLLLFPTGGETAACPQTADQICNNSPSSTADCDGDGYSDSLECSGITLTPSNITVPGWNNRANFPRTGYLDPAGTDIFFILTRPVPEETSLIPPNEPMGVYSSGLGVTTHEIGWEDVQGDRIVAGSQKAVSIVESLDATGTKLGAADQSSPNDPYVFANVYTQRIKNFVQNACASATSCVDISGTAGVTNVTAFYIKNVIAHESGHLVKLTPAYDKRFGWHYAPQSGTVMEQSIKYTSRQGTVTFYISQGYTLADKAGMTLK